MRMSRLVLWTTLALMAPPFAAGARAASPLRVEVEKAKVDLKQHRLEVKMSHPAGKVKITVVGESGATLADEEQDFAGRAPGTPLVVTWSPSTDEPVATIDVHAFDAAGAWVGVQISPWFVAIPHEDVNFKTDRSDIEGSETPKLEAAFAKLNEVLAKDAAHGRQHPGITLFIEGHTDTVGNAAYNLKLSQARARAVAAVSQARRAHAHRLRGLRRNGARGQHGRQRRRAAQPARRLRALRRPSALRRRLHAGLEAHSLIASARSRPRSSGAAPGAAA